MEENFTFLWLALLGFLIAAALIIMFMLLQQNTASIYATAAGSDEYILVKRQYISTKHPTIYLSRLKVPPTGEFAIVLKKHMAKALFGRYVTIETGGVPLHHKVTDFNIDHWFTVDSPTQEEQE